MFAFFALTAGITFCIISFLIYGTEKKTWVVLLVIGVCLVSASFTNVLSQTPFNNPRRTVDVKRGDTLYVVPKGGINGLAVTAGNDTTGLVLVVKKFTAQYTVKPRVEQ